MDALRKFAGVNILDRQSGYLKRMPLYIKDDETARLVAELARLRGITKQDAVRLAVQAELDRSARTIPLRKRFADLRKAYPLPPESGQTADKAFFDELSGDE